MALPAFAADLGGNCCADLEERVAELEATTARKGNRKVSLTVSGYVATEITSWDDGGETNTYVHGLGPTQASNVRFLGQATIVPGWTAGYLIRIQDLQSNPFGRTGSNAIDQNSDDFDQGLNTQIAYWFLASKDLGKVSVGKQMHAAKSAAMFTDVSGTQIFDNYTFLDGFPQFFLRQGNGVLSNVTWGQLAFCYSQALPLGGDCNGLVMNGVRYDTPAFAGFSASASWGEDDFWEVAGRYAGEVHGFKLAFGIGYSEMMDENTSGTSVFAAGKNSDFFQVGGYAQHLETGLFLHAAYGHEDNNDTLVITSAGNKQALDGEHWYVKAGIRRKWTGLGATIVYGDYAQYIDQLGPAALAAGATSATFDRWGAGIAQEIDSAAMTIYVKYQHYEADLEGAALSASLRDIEDADFVSMGGLINF